jgi:hypothetical protein
LDKSLTDVASGLAHHARNSAQKRASDKRESPSAIRKIGGELCGVPAALCINGLSACTLQAA